MSRTSASELRGASLSRRESKGEKTMTQCIRCCAAAGIPAAYAESDVCPVMRWTWGAKVPACRFLGTAKKEKKP